MTRTGRKIIENWVILYYDKVLALSLRLTGNRPDAEDCTQEVFIRAWKKFHTFRGDAHPMAWLKRITINTCYNHLNRNKTKRWDDLEPEEFSAADNEPLSGNLLNPELLRKLSPMERSVLVARVYDDLSFKAVAEALDTSENSAKVTYHNAIQKLRKIMK